MKSPIMATICVCASLFVCTTHIRADEAPHPDQVIHLSPELLQLLRAEMREISNGIQGIALSIAAADWRTIQETSAKISASYIMKQSLTPAQAGELKHALPDRFKRLDADFHQRAERLGAAAAAQDAELTVFHYAHLVESCTRCHAQYASERFPGFARPEEQAHHH